MGVLGSATIGASVLSPKPETGPCPVASGRSIQNALPRPGTECTPVRPPSSAARRRTMARPMPSPRAASRSGLPTW